MQQNTQSNPVKPTKIGNMIRGAEKGVKNFVKGAERKMTKGIVKFVGNTPAGKKLQGGLNKQGIKTDYMKSMMKKKAKKASLPSKNKVMNSLRKTMGY